MTREATPRWHRLAAVGAIIAGLALPLLATRGLTVFTTDGARARDVAEHPRVVPAVTLLDADSMVRPLGSPGAALIVDFIATRCQTLCAAQNGVYQQLQRRIRDAGLTGRIQLVTISFDPVWDTPRALRYFALAQHPDPAVWTVLTPADTGQLRPLLDTFGVRVVREGAEFVHNTALHVVSAEGRLVAIVPIDEPDTALALALQRAASSVPAVPSGGR